MTVGDEAGTQSTGGVQLPSIQEPSPVGGHQTSWWRLIYLFSFPPKDLFISPVFKPDVHPKECLLKPFGLEKGSLPLISLFCSVLASWWVIRGGFGFSVSCYLPAGFQGCPLSSSWPELVPYPAETRELVGQEPSSRSFLNPNSWNLSAPRPAGRSARLAVCHLWLLQGHMTSRGQAPWSLDLGSSQSSHF